ncbi:DUF4041 domain-containing protein [Stenotrophomonas sp. MMGLT7]|uniref:DUF4041 domain-containing protein n=1 Tax=Stenotrophomonas sp. MMGLT7 TaxID=2901227 RepID=UPI001E352408|nr:DUF4041 domain-containing protein [Stenotrophomonas sp. MMGLT7]MCD7099099.1 DUF4041 domain-containing protein [Stenotrophomonas sp. MMGLT7]
MSSDHIPFFGARKYARELLSTVKKLEDEQQRLKEQMTKLGMLSVLELEAQRSQLQHELVQLTAACAKERGDADAAVATARAQLVEVKKTIVETEELALLQEAGIYRYRHPLTDAVAYQAELANIEEHIKSMARKDGGAVLAATSWTVNGSEAQGRKMVNDFSKLMLRAFNAEADNLVRGLKPHRLDAAVERLSKVAETIARLGKTMHIRISDRYLRLRVQELELTADFVHKVAAEKEAERAERERLREERKAQQEMERERARLEKERQHYANALEALVRKGDEEGAARLREQLVDVQRAIEDVDYRAANIRAGYVYVISNLGSFGEEMVKIGMTRRLDPLDRIRELSDASVPFNFDVHALFFSKDAVGIETTMHQRLAARRVNQVNFRREFFRATPLEAKAHLAELAGELLQFQDIPEALEYRESLSRLTAVQVSN